LDGEDWRLPIDGQRILPLPFIYWCSFLRDRSWTPQFIETSTRQRGFESAGGQATTLFMHIAYFSVQQSFNLRQALIAARWQGLPDNTSCDKELTYHETKLAFYIANDGGYPDIYDEFVLCFKYRLRHKFDQG